MQVAPSGAKHGAYTSGCHQRWNWCKSWWPNLQPISYSSYGLKSMGLLCLWQYVWSTTQGSLQLPIFPHWSLARRSNSIPSHSSTYSLHWKFTVILRQYLTTKRCQKIINISSRIRSIFPRKDGKWKAAWYFFQKLFCFGSYLKFTMAALSFRCSGGLQYHWERLNAGQVTILKTNPNVL